MRELPVPAAWAAGTGTSLPGSIGVQSAEPDQVRVTMAGIETAVEAARRYIIKRPRLTRLLDNANARVLMLVAPAGFGKTTLAREWVSDRPHVWYRGSTATADVAALIAGLAEAHIRGHPWRRRASGRSYAGHRHARTGCRDSRGALRRGSCGLARAISGWCFDDYQFAMEAQAPEQFVDVLLEQLPRSGSS